MQCGCQGVSLHGEFPIPGDVILPGQGQHALEQGLEIRRREGAQLHQHPGAAAEVQVQTSNVKHSAFTVNTAVFGSDAAQIQSFHLIGDEALQAEETGDSQSHREGSLLFLHKNIIPAGKCQILIKDASGAGLFAFEKIPGFSASELLPN